MWLWPNWLLGKEIGLVLPHTLQQRWGITVSAEADVQYALAACAPAGEVAVVLAMHILLHRRPWTERLVAFMLA